MHFGKRFFEKEPLDIKCKCMKAVIYVDRTNNKEIKWQICVDCYRREEVKK